MSKKGISTEFDRFKRIYCQKVRKGNIESEEQHVLNAYTIVYKSAEDRRIFFSIVTVLTCDNLAAVGGLLRITISVFSVHLSHAHFLIIHNYL